MATFGAYCLLACNVEHDVSLKSVLFVQSKQALCPKSGHEAFNLKIYTYQEQTAAFKTCLLRQLRRALAEARADLDADRADPTLQRRYAARITILQCQIADAEACHPFVPASPVCFF